MATGSIGKLSDAAVRRWLDGKLAGDGKGLVTAQVSDGGGLAVVLKPGRAPGWVWSYYDPADGRQRRRGYGTFPEVRVAEARDRRDADRRLLRESVDPIRVDRERALAAAAEVAAAKKAAAVERDTFARAADAFFEARSEAMNWSPTHRRDVRRILDEAGRAFGDVPMRDLRRSHLATLIEAVRKRGAAVYARDVVLYVRLVIKAHNKRHLDDEERQARDITATFDRDDLPAARPVKHHPAIDPVKDPDAMVEFMHAMRYGEMTTQTRIALRVLLLTALRTTELRAARWDEIDFDRSVWTVPVERMKYRRKSAEPHRVPLSKQAIAELRALHELTGDNEHGLMFPGAKGGSSVMSEATMLMAVKQRLGFGGRMTPHGFRSTFSTWANGKGFHRDAIERALAHVDANAVRAAYARGDFYDQRATIMQAWADQVDAWERAGQERAQRRAA
jgi:integrase